MASKTIDVLPTDEFRVGNVLHQIRGWKQHRCVWVDGGVGPWVDTTALFAPAIPHSQALAILAAYGLTVEQQPEPVRERDHKHKGLKLYAVVVNGSYQCVSGGIAFRPTTFDTREEAETEAAFVRANSSCGGNATVVEIAPIAQPDPVRVTHAVLDTGDSLYIRFGSEQACKDYVASYDFTNCKVVPCPFTFGGGA